MQITVFGITPAERYVYFQQVEKKGVVLDAVTPNGTMDGAILSAKDANFVAISLE
jgi:hypothetical protein